MALDAFAYIPLLATVFVAIAIFCLLSAINKKRSAKISFIAFLSIVILVCGIIYTLVHPGLMVLSMSIFCASFIFLPYCVITVLLPAKKLEKIEKKNANTIDTTVVPQTPEMNLSLDDAKKDLLDISLDFIVFSESAF